MHDRAFPHAHVPSTVIAVLCLPSVEISTVFMVPPASSLKKHLRRLTSFQRIYYIIIIINTFNNASFENLAYCHGVNTDMTQRKVRACSGFQAHI